MREAYLCTLADGRKEYVLIFSQPLYQSRNGSDSGNKLYPAGSDHKVHSVPYTLALLEVFPDCACHLTEFETEADMVRHFRMMRRPLVKLERIEFSLPVYR